MGHFIFNWSETGSKLDFSGSPSEFSKSLAYFFTQKKGKENEQIKEAITKAIEASNSYINKTDN